MVLLQLCAIAGVLLQFRRSWTAILLRLCCNCSAICTCDWGQLVAGWGDQKLAKLIVIGRALSVSATGRRQRRFRRERTIVGRTPGGNWRTGPVGATWQSSVSRTFSIGCLTRSLSHIKVGVGKSFFTDGFCERGRGRPGRPPVPGCLPHWACWSRLPDWSWPNFAAFKKHVDIPH